MNGSKGKIVGVLIFIVVIVVALSIKYFSAGRSVELTGYVSAEKLDFLNDPKVRRILRMKYGVIIDAEKKSDYDIVNKAGYGIDFLWPSDTFSLDLYESAHPDSEFDSEVCLNTPLVFYSHADVADALISNGTVIQKGTSYYLLMTNFIFEVTESNVSWSDIGLEGFYGDVNIISPDPSQSTAGVLFASTLSYAASGRVTDESNISNISVYLKNYYNQLGYLESSSFVLFEQFLTLGKSKPMIVGYESQIVDYVYHHEDTQDSIMSNVRVIYPVPILWSNHPVITLNDEAEILLTAFKDEGLQEIAMEYYGFRNELIDFDTNSVFYDPLGLPDSIEQVIPLAANDIINTMIEAITGVNLMTEMTQETGIQRPDKYEQDDFNLPEPAETDTNTGVDNDTNVSERPDSNLIDPNERTTADTNRRPSATDTNRTRRDNETQQPPRRREAMTNISDSI